MSAPRCYTPTDSDADPQGLIAPHYQAFIDRIGERAVELAASQGDDAEDYVLEEVEQQDSFEGQELLHGASRLEMWLLHHSLPELNDCNHTNG